MGLEHRDYMREDDRRPPALGLYPGTIGLIIASAIFFLVPALVIGGILPNFTSSGYTLDEFQRTFGVLPERALGSGWIWQFFTYAFLHDPRSLIHILFNMVALFYFGTEVEGLYGTRKFLLLYMGSAVVAGLCYCVDYHIATAAIGASGAIYAIMIVFALHYPTRVVNLFMLFFIIPLEVWLLVLIAIGVDVSTYFLTGARDGVAHLFSFLGGGVVGWLFYRYGGHLEAAPARVEEASERRERPVEEDLDAALDGVLAKINESGMASLTPGEKAILERASKRYRQKS